MPFVSFIFVFKVRLLLLSSSLLRQLLILPSLFFNCFLQELELSFTLVALSAGFFFIVFHFFVFCLPSSLVGVKKLDKKSIEPWCASLPNCRYRQTPFRNSNRKPRFYAWPYITLSHNIQFKQPGICMNVPRMKIGRFYSLGRYKCFHCNEITYLSWFQVQR